MLVGTNFSTSCYYILQQLQQFVESLHLLDFHKHIISKELWIVLCKVKLCPGSFWGSGGAGREQQTALWKWSTAGFNLRFWMEDLLKDIQNQKGSAVMATVGHHTGWAGATDGLDGGAETQNSWDVTFLTLESLTKELWLLSDFERWGQTGQTEGEREIKRGTGTVHVIHLISAPCLLRLQTWLLHRQEIVEAGRLHLAYLRSESSLLAPIWHANEDIAKSHKGDRRGILLLVCPYFLFLRDLSTTFVWKRNPEVG